MKTVKRVLSLLCLMLLLAGCVGVQPANQYQTYVTIDKEFTTLAEQYQIWYTAADAATQARWKQNIDPLFKRADEVLDAYQTILLAGSDPANQIAELRKLKTQILTQLAVRSQK